jgi:hypothetical protein
MPFPPDPNAPGGPSRSEYVSSHYATAREPVAAPKDRSAGIAALRHLRRLEVRIVAPPCPCPC